MALEERKEFIHEFVKNNPTCEATELYDALSDGWPDISRGGHRSLVYRELPEEVRPWEREYKCPTCGVEAQGLEAVHDVFGFRNDGKRRAQSWCRSCRKEDARKRREAKKKEAEARRAAEEESRLQVAKAAEEAIKVDTPLLDMSPEEMAEALTVKDLKKALREVDAIVSGRKDELVSRLHETIHG